MPDKNKLWNSFLNSFLSDTLGYTVQEGEQHPDSLLKKIPMLLK